LLLDELLAERERAQAPEPPPPPPPVLTVDPVAVPPSLDNSRKASRQRMVELENVAMRNYHSAEEARRALFEEHQKLEQELSARAVVQRDAANLRRELDRLTNDDARRAEHERKQAQQEARAAVAEEAKRHQDEHQRVLNEMAALQSAMSEHDSLIDEYVIRLRDEATARAAMRQDLERAESARSLAERSLQRATDSARQGAEDEAIRIATLEQELIDTRSDRDRLAAKVEDLTSGEGALGKLSAQIEDKDAELQELRTRLSGLEARIEASEAAARDADAERDAAVEARDAAAVTVREAEQAREDAGRAADVAAARVVELETELSARGESADEQSREMDRNLGELRREARDASDARRAAEEAAATAETERDHLRARVAELEAEVVRARAEGDRSRASAATSGDGPAAARATVTELQAAAPAHLQEAPADDDAAAAAVTTPPVRPIRRSDSSEESSGPRPEQGVPDGTPAPGGAPAKPRLPSRGGGRRAPVTEPVRRRPKRDPALDGIAAEAGPGVGRGDQPVAPAWVAAISAEPRSKRDAAAAAAREHAAAASEPEPALVAAVVESADPEPAPASAAESPARPAVPEETVRRTAFAEFTALASTTEPKPKR
jgi:chromosome segregation ATPase